MRAWAWYVLVYAGLFLSPAQASAEDASMMEAPGPSSNPAGMAEHSASATGPPGAPAPAPSRNLSLSTSERTNIMHALGKLVCEVDRSPKNFLEQIALMEREEKELEKRLRYIVEMLSILKKHPWASRPARAGEDYYLTTVHHLEELRATIFLVKSIKSILYSQKARNGAKFLLNILIDHPDDEAVRRVLSLNTPHARMSYALGDPKVVFALNCLLIPSFPFSNRIKAQLASKRLNLGDLHKAIQAEVNSLFDAKRFPGGPLFQALYFLRHAERKACDPKILSVLCEMENTLNKAKEAKDNLDAMRTVWPKINPRYKRASNEQFLGLLDFVKSRISSSTLKGSELIFLSIVPVIRCKKGGPPASLPKTNWDAYIVRHLMDKITPPNMASFIAIFAAVNDELRQKGLYFPEANDLQQSAALLTACTSVLDNDFNKIEQNYDWIKEKFQEAMWPNRGK